jgi:predicted DNA-binding protein (MmcQ/YjbR family)
MAKPPFAALLAKLRAAALALPQTTEEFPWGESAFKVAGKTFLFTNCQTDFATFTVKLPASHLMAREMPGVTASGYGLGKSGWCTLRLAPADKPDAALLIDWLDESYRAVAPKALLKNLT